MHKSKSQAKGISANSFLDLKAELSKSEAEFTRNKAAGKSRSIVGGVRRDKKPTVWGRANKGVKDRAARDAEVEEASRPTLESAKAVLERKAKIYDQLQKGKSGGLNDRQYDALLVDFDSKGINSWESDSDDVDESLTVPIAPYEDDPIIEYVDELGRTREARRSEVPREFMPRNEDENEPVEDDDILYNPQDHFPTYQPDAERVAKIEQDHAEDNSPLDVHYDASKEVRVQGAARYQFSKDEQTRNAQMEALKSTRKETAQTRAEMGAVDVRPGEVEGMRAQESSAGTSSARASEKRKRDLEERRKLLDSKRKKFKPAETPPAAQTTVFTASAVDIAEAEQSSVAASSSAVDPFAALEASSSISMPTSIKAKSNARSQADEFLAQLSESAMLSRTRS